MKRQSRGLTKRAPALLGAAALALALLSAAPAHASTTPTPGPNPPGVTNGVINGTVPIPGASS